VVEILYKELSYKIIGAAMEVHRTLGSALVESVFEGALAHEFDPSTGSGRRLQGIPYERQKRLPVFYKGKQVGEFIADPSAMLRTCFVVDGKIIPSTRLRQAQPSGSGHRLELKAVKEINEIHEAQAHNYLAASGLRLAIILNFGAPSLEFKRIVK
jgi:GxxExxY protein